MGFLNNNGLEYLWDIIDNKFYHSSDAVTNIIPFPYFNSSTVISGVSFTINADCSISISGTATANLSYDLINPNFTNSLVLPNGTYTMAWLPNTQSGSS